MVKERAKAKFDETIEIAMNLGVDPRHADQMVRGVVNLPNGSGRSVRVGVFARGAKADEAKAAGADVVGAEDLVEKVQGGTIDFDRCIATPDLMPLVGRLGKVLGPRGLMPNPKVGTVTMDVTGAVKGAKGGSVEFRVEKAGIVQAGVGKASFSRGKAGAEHQGVRRRGAEGEAAGRQGHYHQPGGGVLDHGAGREGRAADRCSRRSPKRPDPSRRHPVARPQSGLGKRLQTQLDRSPSGVPAQCVGAPLRVLQKIMVIRNSILLDILRDSIWKEREGFGDFVRRAAVRKFRTASPVRDCRCRALPA